MSRAQYLLTMITLLRLSLLKNIVKPEVVFINSQTLKIREFMLYTDFEPYDANIFAPVFDQPNLKATYSLDVTAPSDWSIITSVTEQSAQTENEFKSWSFPKSKKFSTYIFSLHGGTI